MELLTQNWNLSKKLRIPAISRLQKMHNVDIVLEILKSRGIQLNDEHGKNQVMIKVFFSLKIKLCVLSANGLFPFAGNAILSKDIVDRHREKTLALLWKIALAFQVLYIGAFCTFCQFSILTYKSLLCPVKTSSSGCY